MIIFGFSLASFGPFGPWADSVPFSRQLPAGFVVDIACGRLSASVSSMAALTGFRPKVEEFG